MDSYIGLGVTIHKRGCSEAYTVIKETKSKKTLTIQRDKAILIEKPKYVKAKKSKTSILINQPKITYRFERDYNGKTTRIKLVKRGYWKIVDMSDIEFSVEIDKRNEFNIGDY